MKKQTNQSILSQTETQRRVSAKTNETNENATPVMPQKIQGKHDQEINAKTKMTNQSRVKTAANSNWKSYKRVKDKALMSDAQSPSDVLS